MFSGLPSLSAASRKMVRSLLDLGRIQVLAAQGQRAHRRNVHAHVLGQFRAASRDLQQHARDRRCVMAVAAARPVDTNHPPDVEYFANPIEQIVLLLPQGRAWLARRRLVQQFVGRLGARPRRQLAGQVVRQLDQLRILRHRVAFALQLDHGANRRIETGEDAKSTKRRFAVGPLDQAPERPARAASERPPRRRLGIRSTPVCSPSSAVRSSPGGLSLQPH